MQIDGSFEGFSLESRMLNGLVSYHDPLDP